MVFGIFKSRDEPLRAPVPMVDLYQSVTPTASLTERLSKDLDALTVKVRKSGNDIPTAVYSKLRVIDDVLRSLLRFIAVQGCSTEQEYFLNAMVTDYIPTTLDKYLQLSSIDKGDDKPAALLLMEQFDKLEDKARDLANMVRTGAVAELSTQAHFIDARLADGR